VPRWQEGAAVCLGLLWLGLGQVAQAAGVQSAQEIVDGVAQLFTSKSSVATVEMQITNPDFQRTISMRFWSVGTSKILIRVGQPAEDAGTAILKLGSKTWIYLPKANRTVQMQDSMMTTPWMGSDFTLNDLASQSRLTDDYAIATSFEGFRLMVAVSEYTLTPKPAAAVVWGKIIMEVRQDNMMPIWQRYFDDGGTLVRELSFFDYKYVRGRLIPTRLVMRPQAQPVAPGREQRPASQVVRQTTITYENIVFDEPISDEIFALKNLKQ
jgi:outer membrane lipoprotein-sorting protein